MPAIEPSSRYREIGTVKVMAAMFMFICCGMNFVFVFYGGGESLSAMEKLFSIGSLAAIILTILAVIFGIMAIFMRLETKLLSLSLKNWFMMLAPIFMIAGSAIKPPIMTVGEIDYMELSLAIVFGVFFLLFIEYLHAVKRFTDIGRMAIERNLKDFDFGHVIRHYISFGFMVLGGIVGISLVVVFLRNVILGGLEGWVPQFARSIEMQSVYGLAISSALVFCLLGIVLSFVFGGREYVTSVRAVTAFSKEKLRELSDRSGSRGQPTEATTTQVSSR
jgi:hypothetical protein